MRGTVAERFWAKVDTSAGPDGCWPWTAFTHPINGYGFFRVSSDRSMVHAHRVAYELATGEQLGKLHNRMSAGERVRQPALRIGEHGCQCGQCGQVWAPQYFAHLANVLGYELPEGVLE